jgi:hypothetical protein
MEFTSEPTTERVLRTMEIPPSFLDQAEATLGGKRDAR